MSNIVRYNGINTRGPSPRVIGGDLAKLYDDARRGCAIVLFDDFGFPTKHASAGASGGYYTYQDTGVEIQGRSGSPDLGQELGVLEVSGNDADNDEGHIQFGTGGQFRIDNGSGNTGKVIFEARFNIADVTDNGVSVFLGLGEPNVAADHLVDDTGALLATGGFIGFRTLAADGDVLEAVFQAASQTVNTVGDAVSSLTNSTWVKCGFVYEPEAVDPDKKIRFYIDGADTGLAVSSSELDEATFPEGEDLQPMFLTKVGSASEVKVEYDWVVAAAYNDNSVTN